MAIFKGVDDEAKLIGRAETIEDVLQVRMPLDPPGVNEALSDTRLVISLAAINSARNRTHYVDEEVNICQGRELVEDANQAFNESREDIFAAISTVGQYVRAELLVS